MRTSYSKRLGARILSESNDLKRTPIALAEETGYQLDIVLQIINGNAPVSEILKFITKIVSIYPIKRSDLEIDIDDSKSGALILKKHESFLTSRVFSRVNNLGIETPYYEYRDTAISRLCPFKPEWIKPLVISNSDNPEDPIVVYNRGHLLHQLTFFIGEVNFYWREGGRSFMERMNTGDSNLIMPFYPHSFSSRDPEKLGLIIAVTYSGEFKRAINDISQYNQTDLEDLSGNLSSAQSLFITKLHRYMLAESYTSEALIKALFNYGFEDVRAIEILHGKLLPSEGEIEIIANILNVSPERLGGNIFNNGDGVINKNYSESKTHAWPSFKDAQLLLTPLVRSQHQPYVKSFAAQVIKKTSPSQRQNRIKHGLHEYIFNYGDVPILIEWGDGNSEILNPGDSAIFHPMIEHNFSLTEILSNDETYGKLLIIRAPGMMGDEALDEYAMFSSENKIRALKETNIWF